MLKCKDPEKGVLLHAYEIDALPDQEAENFELHLLKCEYCFNRVKEFEDKIRLLSHDKEVKILLQESAEEKPAPSGTPLQKFRRYLWPPAPVFFKPALTYVIILLLIIPAYFGLIKMTKKTEKDYQAIYLYDFRSTGENVFKISDGLDGKIKFRFAGAVPGKKYRLLIKNENGNVIFRDDAFSGFNEYGAGTFIFPHEDMEPGKYILMMIDPDKRPPLKKEEHFEIIE